jgi:UDP-N-acetylglucosamine 2-epimerase (non-hydrolysing)
VTIRQAHERPEGMDEGVLIMCGLKKDRVMEAVKIVTDQASGKKRLFSIVRDYRSKNVSEKIVRIIASYTDYVNRIVWQKTL